MELKWLSETFTLRKQLMLIWLSNRDRSMRCSGRGYHSCFKAL